MSLFDPYRVAIFYFPFSTGFGLAAFTRGYSYLSPTGLALHWQLILFSEIFTNIMIQ